MERVHQRVFKVKRKCAEIGFPAAEKKLELPQKHSEEVMGYIYGRKHALEATQNF